MSRDCSYCGQRPRATARLPLAIAALAFAVVAAHPGSPILFQLLGPDYRLGYPIWCLFGCLMIHCAIRASSRRDQRPEATDWIYWYRAVLGLVLMCLALQSIATLTYYALREMSAAIFLWAASYLVTRQIRDLAFYAVVVTCLFNLISIVTVATFVGLDIPLYEWSVDSLRWISSSNPAYGRGDFDYWAMPAYLTVIPVERSPSEIALGYRAQRFPLLYSEATFVWAAALPALFAATFGRGFGGWRYLVIAISFASLSMCPGVWGFLVAVLTLAVAALARCGRKVLFLVSAFCAASLFATVGYWLEPALTTLGGNKASQLAYFRDVIVLDSFVSVWGKLGDNVGADPASSYGWLFVAYRFGLVGVFAGAVFVCFSLLRLILTLTSHRKSSVDVALALAALASMLMSLKQTSMIALWSGLFISALCRAADANNRSQEAPA